MKRSVVHITTHEAARHDPSAVLVFCWIDGGVVWVQHSTRGWEVPGGKIEPGESPDVAAHREVVEESGVIMDHLTWVGEYGLADDSGAVGVGGVLPEDTSFKWVYTAQVRDVSARPTNSETVDVQVVRPAWTPDQVSEREDISYVMKDAAYATLWPTIVEVARRLFPADV